MNVHRSVDVVTIGLHTVDVLARPVSEIPPGGGVAFVEELTMTVAGTAGAGAVDLARLGVATATVGCVGHDPMGEFMRNRMHAEGIDISALTAVDGVQTAATILPIRPDGSRPALTIQGASAALTAELVPWEIVETAKVLHFGGFGLLPGIDGQPAAAVLERAKEAGLIVTLDFFVTGDPDFCQKLEACLPYVDYLLPSLEDACTVAGTEDRAEAIAWFHDRGVGCTVFTMDANGVSVTPRGQAEQLKPAFLVDVVDTTGCGDAFSAGYITALLDGADSYQAAELGLATGSLVATGLGSDAGITDRAGVERFAATTPRREPTTR